MDGKLSGGSDNSLNQKDLTASRTAQYWVAFLQPLPEAGERIAVALVFRDVRKRPWIRFDDRFSKVLKLYPGLDQSALKFYLESLQQDLSSCDDVETTLNSYGPQIAVSSPRRTASPISRQIVEMLLRRYIYPSEERSVPLVAGAENCAREQYLARTPETWTTRPSQQNRAADLAKQANLTNPVPLLT